jgi:hypothetical protein
LKCIVANQPWNVLKLYKYIICVIYYISYMLNWILSKVYITVIIEVVNNWLYESQKKKK